MSCRWRYCLLGAGLILLCLVAVVSCMSRQMVFWGSVGGDLPSDERVEVVKASQAVDAGKAREQLRAARLQLPMEDGTKLSGWFFNRGPEAPLVMMFGGNNMHIGGFLDVPLADASRSYLLLNYRGYGESEGEPSEEKVVADACLAYDWAVAQLGGHPAAVSAVGFSLGSGVAVQLAARRPLSSLVLVCPFDSLVEVACDFVPLLPRLVLRDRFDSAVAAPGIRCPLVILAAEQDSIVRPPHTQKLREAFNRDHLYRSYPCDHNDVFAAPGFAEDLLRTLPAGPSPLVPPAPQN